MSDTSSHNPGTQTLSQAERRHVVKLTYTLYEKAARHFGCAEPGPAVLFDLYGRAAGQWRVRQHEECLRFNERLFAAAPELHIPDTVAHEVAHCVVYRCHGHDRRPHGPEWREVMAFLGCRPEVTHRTPAETMVRVLRHRLYRCACTSHALGPRQHRQALDGKRHYRCRACGERLVWQGQDD